MSATETISAVAIASGMPNSIVALGTYTILTPTLLSVTASPNPANLGTSVTLTATLSPFSTNSQSSNGESITFNNGMIALGTGVLSDGVATLQTTALPAGTASITASYPGDADLAASTSSSLTETVVAPNFSLSLNPTTATVTAGGSTQATLTVVPVGGLTQQINLACSGLPAHAACSFSPTNITPNGTNSSTQSTVTISTNLATSSLDDLAVPGTHRLPIRFALVTLGVFFLMGTGRRSTAIRGRFFRAILFAGVLMGVGGATLTGCGGGSGSSGTTPPSNQTPAGTYTVTVAGTAGNLSQSVTLTLTVN